jgi:hypothetical protein
MNSPPGSLIMRGHQSAPEQSSNSWAGGGCGLATTEAVAGGGGIDAFSPHAASNSVAANTTNLVLSSINMPAPRSLRICAPIYRR